MKPVLTVACKAQYDLTSYLSLWVDLLAFSLTFNLQPLHLKHTTYSWCRALAHTTYLAQIIFFLQISIWFIVFLLLWFKSMIQCDFLGDLFHDLLYIQPCHHLILWTNGCNFFHFQTPSLHPSSPITLRLSYGGTLNLGSHKWSRIFTSSQDSQQNLQKLFSQKGNVHKCWRHSLVHHIRLELTNLFSLSLVLYLGEETFVHVSPKRVTQYHGCVMDL